MYALLLLFVLAQVSSPHAVDRKSLLLTDNAQASPPPVESVESEDSQLLPGIKCLCNDHKGCHVDRDTNYTVCKSAGVRRACYTAKELLNRNGRKMIRKSFGCVRSHSNTFRCQGGATALYSPDRPKAIECCNTSYCNIYLNPPLHSAPPGTGGVWPGNSSMAPVHPLSALQLTLLSVCCLCVAGLFALLLGVCLWPRVSAKRAAAAASRMAEGEPCLTGTSSAAGSSQMEPPSVSSLLTSGTGGGASLLLQKTIAREVRLEKRIGAPGGGRFANVWLGEWRGEPVAVKLFPPVGELWWRREANLYQNCLLRHDNVLCFVAADICHSEHNGIGLQRLLIAEYHFRGSLRQSLHSPGGVKDVLQVAYTLSAGLCYLHTEVSGSRGKPALAHRNLQSSNVLLRDDGASVCISDLEMAVRGDTTNWASSLVSVEELLLVGNSRYAAPEMLSGEFDEYRIPDIDDFRRSDVYAMGLILWELYRYLAMSESEYQYQSPFEEFTQNFIQEQHQEPNVHTMRTIVCEQTKRPSQPLTTVANTTTSVVSGNDLWRDLWPVLVECWTQRPDARLTALRAKKSLGRLLPHEESSYVII